MELPPIVLPPLRCRRCVKVVFWSDRMGNYIVDSPDLLCRRSDGELHLHLVAPVDLRPSEVRTFLDRPTE